MSDSAALSSDEIALHLRSLRSGCEALRLNSANYELQYSMWNTLNRLGKWEEAVTALKAALRGGYGPLPKGPKAALERVALVAVDCADPDLAALAMQVSLARCQFREALLFTDRAVNAPGVRSVPIPPITSGAAYSEFVIKSLVCVDADYVLIMQWDGYVVDASKWSEQFLLFDYVGARWPHFRDHHTIGNGGFSLRSMRLLRALQDPDVHPLHPEDGAICRVYRDYLERQHGIVFAPEDVAESFSFEYDISTTQTFGFHGMIHLPRFVDEPVVKSLAFVDPLVERWADELLGRSSP
jgi:hypothetical protein